MVGMNGIPRAPSPGRLEQRVRDLERTLERLTSARTYVSVGNIVEGGTIGQAAGAQLTETVQQLIIVESGNLAPDALNNKALYGSSVTAAGEYTAGDSANPGNPYNPLRQVQTRAVLDARQDPDALSGKTRWPGVFLEADDPAVPGPAPYQPARMVGGETGQAQLFSRQETPTSPKSEVRASPSEAAIRATGDPHPTNKLPGSYSMVSVGANVFRLESAGQPDIVGSRTAAVTHNGDGVLRLDGPNGVLVNGAPIGGGGGSPTSWQPPLNAGWTHRTVSGWNGLWVYQLGKLTIVTGAVSRSSWYDGQTIANLPDPYRPAAKAGGTNCEIQPDGSFNVGAAGSVGTAMSITYFAK